MDGEWFKAIDEHLQQKDFSMQFKIVVAVVFEDGDEGFCGYGCRLDLKML